MELCLALGYEIRSWFLVNVTEFACSFQRFCSGGLYWVSPSCVMHGDYLAIVPLVIGKIIPPYLTNWASLLDGA